MIHAFGKRQHFDTSNILAQTALGISILKCLLWGSDTTNVANMLQ